MANFKLFNASGHPIQQDGVEVTGNVRIGNVDVSSVAAVLEAAKKIAVAAAPHARKGIPIALPGMTTLSAQVLAYLHGLVGHWPTIAWSARIDGVFTWSLDQVADLHDIRTSAREAERV